MELVLGHSWLRIHIKSAKLVFVKRTLLPTQWILRCLILVIWLILFATNSPHLSALDEVVQLQQQISELENLKKLSEDATTPLEGQVKDLESKITNAQAGIAKAKSTALEVAESIDEREEDLSYQYTILSRRIGDEYKRTRQAQNPIMALAQLGGGSLIKSIAYQQSAQQQDKTYISNISGDIIQLEKDKKALEERQQTLAQLQVQLDEQADFFKGEIAKAKDYQAKLRGQIATLTARQQQILSERSGTYTTSVGEVPLADDFNASIGFKSQAPSNSFAVFSFGGYTHRNGMSQYGAKARAESGQTAEAILRAYYPNAQLKKDYPEMGSISVEGYGGMSFEDQYLQGIYEMPASWHMEALKAQAIAARTFAIKYTNNGSRSICTTEACQVFKNSKKGGDWERAVNDTKGWVLVDGAGAPVSTQYASSHGGYSNTSGWDTTDGSKDGEWSTRAWENKSGSPWFYKAWYRSGYFKTGANCGRNHPWLSQEEFSDIVNAWIVRKNPSGADVGRIQPVSINECGIGGGGGNPYSMSELKDWANKAGGAVTNVSGVSVSHTGEGQTANVTLQTNRGTLSIPGSEFKTTFNLRAPGYLRIPQTSFAHFNVEKKD